MDWTLFFLAWLAIASIVLAIYIGLIWGGSRTEDDDE